MSIICGGSLAVSFLSVRALWLVVEVVVLTLMMRKTAGGMLSRLVLNLSKPRWRRVRVRYWSGGPLGMWNVNAMMYRGLA